jgi:hypothetical protein
LECKLFEYRIQTQARLRVSLDGTINSLFEMIIWNDKFKHFFEKLIFPVWASFKNLFVKEYRGVVEIHIKTETNCEITKEKHSLIGIFLFLCFIVQNIYIYIYIYNIKKAFNGIYKYIQYTHTQ